MSEDAIVNIVIAVLGSGGLWALLQAVLPKREPPIQKADAETVSAHSSQQMTMALLHTMQEELAAAREDWRQEREAREHLEDEVRDLQRDRAEDRQDIGLLWQAVEVLVGGWHEIQERWDVLRHKPSPPPLPRFRVPPRRGSTAADPTIN